MLVIRCDWAVPCVQVLTLLLTSLCRFWESVKFSTASKSRVTRPGDRREIWVPILTPSTLSEVRWVLGSESLEDGEEEEELLEKNNNDSQDRLDRVTGCVRCDQVPVRWTFQLTFPSLRFKDVGDGSDTQYLSSSDPNKYSTSKICPLLFF